MDRSRLPAQLEELLKAYRFDESCFDELVERLSREERGEGSNAVREPIAPPPAEAWMVLPQVATAQGEELARRGLEAIERGQVGVLVLNGGMATRFGGLVKCAVEVLSGRSFLDLKVRQIMQAGRGRVPVLLMNSFATDERTRELARELGLDPSLVRHFSQGVMLRVTPQGELFLEDDGQPSPYAPGHGDLVDSLQASGLLERFIDEGGRYLMMSNVDNLGATLDPAVIGAHLAMGGEMTVELVAKEPGDRGGAPALLGGRVQIIEQFRFPSDFDQDRIPVFNTNTFVFDAQALRGDFELTWFAVSKKVEGRPAVQFERLAGELSAFLGTRYLLVEREGSRSRFLPVKDPDELEHRRPAIGRLMRACGVSE